MTGGLNFLLVGSPASFCGMSLVCLSGCFCWLPRRVFTCSMVVVVGSCCVILLRFDLGVFFVLCCLLFSSMSFLDFLLHNKVGV